MLDGKTMVDLVVLLRKGVETRGNDVLSDVVGALSDAVWSGAPAEDVAARLVLVLEPDRAGPLTCARCENEVKRCDCQGS